MSQIEYTGLWFFWNILLSVDVALGVNAASTNVSTNKKRILILIRLLNLLLFQIAIPTLGYIYYFTPIPIGERYMVLPCFLVIGLSLGLPSFLYWWGFRGKPIQAQHFLALILCIGSAGTGIGLIYLDRKYAMLSDWFRILMAVFMLLYGYICLRRIARNIACELQEKRCM